MKVKNQDIGYAKCDVKAGDTIAEICFPSGKVVSKVLRFKPWGKIKLVRALAHKEKI